ncbi:MAG: sigma-54 dependent transcriptional regulator [Desulfovibrio sp.]|uniref:sigma-54 interaction domain-containing protein n=1 Tax=Desulfovibrio sp. TaxID=885 RepID=UPI0025B8A900|nr:sigma-54 dependent transcriptional regulator [Desulfovibrio sp.]MCI7568142.1 sigma-54 dependent transcriptional regulator [Desulfovibrio sp.]
MKLNTSGIIGQSTTLADVFKMLAKVAPTDSTVLVTGESGTGKELLVRALHDNSRRADKLFVPINCGAIPKELLESELFGHEKGAFTNALRSRAGRFELADGGTIFLDEIGEMDLSLQVKILRVLQEREFERVGGNVCKEVDVRIVAATNRDLEAEVAAGRFREDLFYRLNVIPLHLPPLRERGGDVLLLSRFFLDRFCLKKERPPLTLDPQVRSVFMAYQWPGNVRELENLMERLSILVDGDVVHVDDLPAKVLAQVGDVSLLPESPMPEPEAPSAACEVSSAGTTGPSAAAGDAPCPPPSAGSGNTAAPAAGQEGFLWPTLQTMNEHGGNLKDFLDAVEMRLINEALQRADGVKNQAAELLGIKRTTLIEKLKKKGV